MENSTTIVTVTLNPCLDRTVSIGSEIKIGGTNRILETREDVSGKGVNVSTLFHDWGYETEVLTIDFLEEADSRVPGPMARALTEREIDHQLISIPGKLRCNTKVFEKTSGTMTEFNEKGEPLSETQADAFLKMIENRIREMREDDILILTGSIPPGIPTDVYRKLITCAHETNEKIRVVLDASGEALLEGIKAVPYAIKPNLDELEVILGHSLTCEKEILDAGKDLLSRGLTYVCATLGGEGAYLIGPDGDFRALPLQVEVKGIQGAGDSMVCGVCLALMEKKTGADILRYGTAAAGGSVMRDGTLMCLKTDFEKLLPTCEILTLS